MNGIHYWNGKQMVACDDDVIDYAKLLRKYVEHVVNCTDMSGLEWACQERGRSPAFDDNHPHAHDVEFTDSERLCLENIARQAGCMHMGGE